MRRFHRVLFSVLLAVPAASPAQQVVKLPGEDRPLALRPTPIYSVGVDEGEPHQMFARVMAVAFDAADNLYVLDSGNHRVVVFGPDGRHLRTTGRQGGGPGEFGLPLSLTALADGELVVADAMRSDLQRFGPDGALLGAFPLGEHRVSGRLQAHPRGGFVATAAAAPSRFEGAPPPRTQALHWFRGGAGDAGSPLFTMRPQETAALELKGSGEAAGGASRMMMVMPPVFAPTLNWGVLPNGLLAVNAVEEYRIEIVDEAGRSTRVLERPIAPRRVTERDRAAYRERQREGGSVMIAGGNAAINAQLQASMANLTFSERIPAIRTLVADPFGRLWIVRYGDDGAAQGPIDLIDAVNGTYLGTLPAQPLPAAFSRTGRVAYIERDELDVQRVVVKQVPHAPR